MQCSSSVVYFLIQDSQACPPTSPFEGKFVAGLDGSLVFLMLEPGHEVFQERQLCVWNLDSLPFTNSPRVTLSIQVSRDQPPPLTGEKPRDS